MRLAERPWVLRGLIAALLVAVVVLALVITGDDGDDGTVADAVAPRIVSVTELSDTAAGSDFPIYWTGPKPRTELELTQGNDGSALLRYLPVGAKVGAAAPSAVSVGTYPLADPARAVVGLAQEQGAQIRSGADERTVVSTKRNPRSAYFADPGNTVQVEVYDPSPGQALKLAASKRVRPVQ